MTDHILANASNTQDGVVVACLCSVLLEIRDVALHGDVSGILLGTKDDARVRILAFRRMVPKRSLGRGETLSTADRDALARLIWAPPADNELYGLEPVGWFRAQPRRDLDLSGWELDLLNSCFTDGRQVGMILRAASFGPTRARFYVRESAGFLTNVYREISLPVAMDGRPMLTVAPGGPHADRSEPFAPALQQLLQPDIEDEDLRQGSRPVWGWIWRTVSSLALAGFVLGYWWISSVRQQAGPADLPRRPDIPAEADRRQLPPLSPDVPAKLDQSFSADDSLSARELADLAKELKPDDERVPPVQPSPDRFDPPANRSPDRPTAVASARTEPLRARSLHPLRVITPPRKPGRVPDLAPPPQLANETAPSLFQPLPLSVTMVPPARTVAPKAAAPSAPANGSLIWTGRLRKNATVIIDGKNASFGTVTGELPGRPVQFHVYPGDLADNGILVFTSRQQDAHQGWDSAGPQNGWNRIMYEFDPRHAEGIEVQEAPSPANSWKRLVLRCNNAKLSVIFVKWSLDR